MESEELIRIARGDQPADLLLKHARLINIYSGEIYQTDIAIAGEHMAALGPGYNLRTVSNRKRCLQNHPSVLE